MTAGSSCRAPALGDALQARLNSGRNRLALETHFAESEGSRCAWLFVLIECYLFVETIFFREGLFDRLVYLTLGVAILDFGAADLLPRDPTRPAGPLRIGGVGLVVLNFSCASTTAGGRGLGSAWAAAQD